MSIALKTLCAENDNIFKLKLCAGGNGFRNTVAWVYVLEDDSIIPYFHGSELAVTSGIRAVSDPAWLGNLVGLLYERGAAGLVINTGKYVFSIPKDILEWCDGHDFPLLTMPWEIHMTEMIQTFCTRIIQERQDSIVLDRALTDAVNGAPNEDEYRDILSRHYDVEGQFNVILIHTSRTDEEVWKPEGHEFKFIDSLRHFKTLRGMSGSKFGVIDYDKNQLMVANNVDRKMLPELIKIIQDVYADAVAAKALFIGVGTEVRGIASISRSFRQAEAAMRMALYRGAACVRFEEMGFYRILFSVKDEEVVRSYARDVLGPILNDTRSGPDYLELLSAYIENDRSLERTAEALYLHRNTVNYRLQKLKTLLDSPLKTVEDLFPYQVALAILDMEQNENR